MHYGTPASLDDVEPYYTHIRRGRTPSPEQLQDLISRYEAIGGPSPLTRISERQAELIRKGLERRGIAAKAYVGAKHAHPFVGEAVEEMAKDNVIQAAGVVLAPHYSGFSIAQIDSTQPRPGIGWPQACLCPFWSGGAQCRNLSKDWQTG